MTHNLLDYPQRLRRAGFRVTPQRRIILDAICETGHRVPIEEILARVRKKDPALNRATLYRNLTFLEKMRLVDSTALGKSRAFEIASLKPHHHLVCRTCGEEEGLDPRLVESLRATIRKKHRFVIDSDHLSFQGLCDHCSRQRNRKFKRVLKNSE